MFLNTLFPEKLYLAILYFSLLFFIILYCILSNVGSNLGANVPLQVISPLHYYISFSNMSVLDKNKSSKCLWLLLNSVGEGPTALVI